MIHPRLLFLVALSMACERRSSEDSVPPATVAPAPTQPLAPSIAPSIAPQAPPLPTQPVGGSSDVTAIQQRVMMVEQRTSALEQQVAALQQSQANTQQQLANTQLELRQTQAQVAGMQNQARGARRRINDMMQGQQQND